MSSKTLNNELSIFQKLIEIEKQKRKFILSANGKEILNLSNKSATCLNELSLLEKERKKQNLNNNNNENDYDSKKFIKEINKFENYFFELKELVISNQELLKESNNKIKQIIYDLQKEDKYNEKNIIYKPEISKKTKSKWFRASFLNKGA